MSFFYTEYLSGSGTQVGTFADAVQAYPPQHLSDGSTVWVAAMGNDPSGGTPTYQAWLFHSPDHKTVVQVTELNSAIETDILNAENGGSYTNTSVSVLVDASDNLYVVSASGTSNSSPADRAVHMEYLTYNGSSSWVEQATYSYSVPVTSDSAGISVMLDGAEWVDAGSGYLFLSLNEIEDPSNPTVYASTAAYFLTMDSSGAQIDLITKSYTDSRGATAWYIVPQTFGASTGLIWEENGWSFQTWSIDSSGSVTLGTTITALPASLQGAFLGLNDGETIAAIGTQSGNLSVGAIVNGVLGASASASESSLGFTFQPPYLFQDPSDPNSFWLAGDSYGNSNASSALQVTMVNGVPTFGELLTLSTTIGGGPGPYAPYARGTTPTADGMWIRYSSSVANIDGSYSVAFEYYYGSLSFYKTGSGSVELEPVLLRSVQTITGNASVPLSSGVATNTLRGYRQGTVFGTTPYGSSTYGDPSRSVQSGNFSAAPLTARALDYYSILLSWEIPAAGTQIQLVRNNFSAPADQNDGIVLLSGDPASAATYTDTALSLAQQGTFLYYTLWNYGKDPISGLTQWWRAADVQTILPKQWGYGPNLFGLIPEKYRADDDALSVVLSVLVDNYTELAGATAYSSAQGQPLMVIGMEGGASTQSGGALRPSPTGGAKAQSSASGDPDEAISADSVAETRAGSSSTASPTWRTL